MSDIKLTLGNEAPAAATQTAEEIMPEKKVPEPAQPVFTPEEQKTIDEFSKKIDVTDTNLVFQYGAGTQQKIAQFSDSALASVQTSICAPVCHTCATVLPGVSMSTVRSLMYSGRRRSK